MTGRERAAMGKVLVKLPNVTWRDGRPRFNPGKPIVAMGYKSQVLQHADGRWFSFEEAHAWALKRAAEIEARRTAKADTGRMPARPKERLLTVEGLFDLWTRHPTMQGKTVEEGKHVFKAKSQATVTSYKQKARVIEQEAPELWGAAVAALDKVILFNLYERIAVRRGLATAVGCMRTLSAALSFGMRRGLAPFSSNPAEMMGMETPAPRLRVGEREEMDHLIATADQLGRPEIADCIMLGLWTGQRQSERIDLIDEGLLNNRRIFRQRKTGAIVAIPEAPRLAARLVAAKARRKAIYDAPREDRKPAPIRRMELVIDEKANTPFKPDYYRHVFAAIREVAVHGLVETAAGICIVLVDDSEARAIRHYLPGLRGLLAGEAEKVATLPRLIAPMPALAGFRDQDLRDTAVTWLALAGATIPEIAAVTGHSLQSITSVLEHYLARHPELADHAIAKLVTWHG